MRFVKVFHSEDLDFIVGVHDEVEDTDLFLDNVLHGAAGWSDAKKTVREAIDVEWDDVEDSTCGCIEKKTIYTHDIAARIVEMLEDVLTLYNISVPSPEDEDRDPEDMIGLYGSTYSDLFDGIESEIIDLLKKHEEGAKIVVGKFSGRF